MFPQDSPVYDQHAILLYDAVHNNGEQVGPTTINEPEIAERIERGDLILDILHAGIDLVFLPVGSPDPNPIEPVWKSLRWEASPLIVESAEEFRALVTDLFDRLTDRVSFAVSWIEKFLAPHLQKLPK